MYLAILRWEGGKLVVDGDSLHYFGTDIPEGFDAPRDVYEIEIASIKQLEQ